MTVLTAWKTSVDAVKGTIDLLWKIVPASGANEQQKQTLENALLTASSTQPLQLFRPLLASAAIIALSAGTGTKPPIIPETDKRALAFPATKAVRALRFGFWS